MRNPRSATPAATHSIARGRRHAANAALQFIRENTRDTIGINWSADLLDNGLIGHSSRRIVWLPGEGRAMGALVVSLIILSEWCGRPASPPTVGAADPGRAAGARRSGC